MEESSTVSKNLYQGVLKMLWQLTEVRDFTKMLNAFFFVFL